MSLFLETSIGGKPKMSKTKQGYQNHRTTLPSAAFSTLTAGVALSTTPYPSTSRLNELPLTMFEIIPEILF